MSRINFAASTLIVFAFSLFGLIETSHALTTVKVFAASSLTASYQEMGSDFGKSHPSIKISFVFGSSSTLATQIQNGASADILVAASPIDMKKVARGQNYLVNRVVLAFPSISTIARFSDLNSGVKWIRCANEVPCGAAARKALLAEKIKSAPVSLEPTASTVIAKLLAGEVDAAIVYKTDVVAHEGVLKSLEFTSRNLAKTQYQIASLNNQPSTKEVLSYLKSKDVLNNLYSRGFEIS